MQCRQSFQNIQKCFILKDKNIFLGLYPSDDLRVVLHVHFVALQWKISTMFGFSGFFPLFHSRACKQLFLAASISLILYIASRFQLLRQIKSYSQKQNVQANAQLKASKYWSLDLKRSNFYYCFLTIANQVSYHVPLLSDLLSNIICVMPQKYP